MIIYKWSLKVVKHKKQDIDKTVLDRSHYFISKSHFSVIVVRRLILQKRCGGQFLEGNYMSSSRWTQSASMIKRPVVTLICKEQAWSLVHLKRETPMSLVISLTFYLTLACGGKCPILSPNVISKETYGQTYF